MGKHKDFSNKFGSIDWRGPLASPRKISARSRRKRGLTAFSKLISRSFIGDMCFIDLSFRTKQCDLSVWELASESWAPIQFIEWRLGTYSTTRNALRGPEEAKVDHWWIHERPAMIEARELAKELGVRGAAQRRGGRL